MKRLVVLSGAGISAESGLSTFRDSNGLWDQFPIEEVATFEAWKKNPKKVNDFYNLRRENCYKASPNEAHEILADLEKKFRLNIITQNIDDLHERAGSKNVLHLHGLITNSRSSGTGEKYNIPKGKHISFGEKCPNGHLLRPDVVWFGEEVPNLVPASYILQKAEILLVIGTSLQVYPAASLIYEASKNSSKFVIDPNELNIPNDFYHIKKNAIKGMKEITKLI
jgi:NAD-dependent deacetylase